MIPIAKPVLGTGEADAARDAVLSGSLIQGPQVAAFEQEFAQAVGAGYACAVSSCTTALHLALLAVGVRPGDEVITVSHSFIATTNAIRYCGAVPVFVDITADIFNLDPNALAVAITRRTRAILCVHQMGMPCDLRQILAIARAHRMPVIEDAACAVGSEIRLDGTWHMIGRPHGDIACFSFHPGKVITTGDGGMLTTSHANYDRLFRVWRQHGMSSPETARHSAASVIFEDYPVLGYNYRMTDVQAALGLSQMGRLGEFHARRHELARRYDALLSDLPVTVPWQHPDAVSGLHLYIVRLKRPEIRRSHREVFEAMRAAAVGVNMHYIPVHRQPYYEKLGLRRADYPEAERYYAEAITLPLFPVLTNGLQDRVVGTLRDACRA
jgi:dTDP-4-amino-4,6-dideoxygalactose transaminase